MPDDSPKPSKPDGFDFADETAARAGRKIADYGTLDADLSKVRDEEAEPLPDALPVPSSTHDYGTLDPNLSELLNDAPIANAPASMEAASPADQVFELVEANESPREIEEPAPPPRARPAVRESKSRPSEPRPEARVDEVWSRGGEWGPTLVILGAVGLATLVLTYFALNAGQWGFGFAILCLGAIAFVVLSYPIVITLERPVRMTPEQAVRDFYAALSHHRPHFRRMWLLLSTNGRTSSRFGSFEGFVACWKGWLQELRGEGESAWTPLHFEIGNVKAEKSAGQSVSKMDFSLGVFVRGRRDEEPLTAYNLRQWTVRGPDGMWYLDDGNPPAKRNGSETDRQGVNK
jgi:hypothetical protein